MVKAMEACGSGSGATSFEVAIADCGVLAPGATQAARSSSSANINGGVRTLSTSALGRKGGAMFGGAGPEMERVGSRGYRTLAPVRRVAAPRAAVRASAAQQKIARGAMVRI